MGYIRLKDYDQTIQAEGLKQINGDNDAVRLACEASAIDEMKSYLTPKFNIDIEFRSIELWNPSLTYNAYDRIHIEYDAWNIATAYVVGDKATYQDKAYNCTIANTGQAPTTLTGWALIGDKYDLYYAHVPFPPYLTNTQYYEGDQVFWKNKTYTASKDSINVYPDSTTQTGYWADNGDYEVPASTLLSNTTYWTLGDNRSLRMLECALDITLFKIHKRIAPRNIPEHRYIAYMGKDQDKLVYNNTKVVYPIYSALGWLQSCASGEDVNVSVVEVEPKQGHAIKSSQSPKNLNNY